MIKASYDEEFTLTASVVDIDDGMVSSVDVVCEIWTDDEANLIDGPVSMTESTVASGVYIYTTFIDQSEYNTYGSQYRAYFITGGEYANGAEDIAIHDRSYDIGEHGNLSVENVLVIGSEIPGTNPRNLSAGVTNFVKTKIKLGSDSNWDSASPTFLVYAWYNAVGDLIPYKMDKKAAGEPAYTGE